MKRKSKVRTSKNRSQKEADKTPKKTAGFVTFATRGDYKKHFLAIGTFLIVLVAGLCAPAAQITVFAAASLSDSLKQIAADYQKASGGQVVFNLAASGVLARQIQAGAPADIFFSADEAQMNQLAAKGALVAATRRDLLGNSLVIVTPADSTAVQSPFDLTNAAVQHIALGDARTVPAGSYAKSYLQTIGIWRAIQPKVVPSENVRAVLAVVESGNADAGIVYKTDAAISRKVKVAFAVPAADGPKITYPVALLKDAPQPEAARKFLAYLESESAAAVFQKAGFTVSR